MTIQSSGSNVVLGTTTRRHKRLNQPSRVTTSTMPSIAQETVIAAGTAERAHEASTLMPRRQTLPGRFAHRESHWRQQRPWRQVLSPPAKVIAGAESLICHHLLHLIQPFKQRNRSTNNPRIPRINPPIPSTNTGFSFDASSRATVVSTIRRPSLLRWQSPRQLHR